MVAVESGVGGGVPVVGGVVRVGVAEGFRGDRGGAGGDRTEEVGAHGGGGVVAFGGGGRGSQGAAQGSAAAQGRGVVGGGQGFGLWGDVEGLARRVAVAVAEQAPSADERKRLGGLDVPLTAGLALAFADQTLVAVRSGAPELVAVVEQARGETLRALSSLQHARNRHRTARGAWTRALVAFVDGVNDKAEGEVWAVLREWLLGGPADGGVSGAGAAAGAEAGGVSVAGPGGVGPSGPVGSVDPQGPVGGEWRVGVRGMVR